MVKKILISEDVNNKDIYLSNYIRDNMPKNIQYIKKKRYIRYIKLFIHIFCVVVGLIFLILLFSFILPSI